MGFLDGKADMLDIHKQTDNLVYILKVQLSDGQILYKIGVTKDKRHMDRMLEVLKGFFVKYRYIPFTSIKRFRVFPDAYEVERLLHSKYKDLQYCFDKKFCGCTEFFTINDEQELLDFYEELHSNKESHIKRS
jgi:hypothetical protein